MKAIFVLSILALAISPNPCFSQGAIQFDNYNSNHGDGFPTTYGAGVAGHPSGTGLTPGWTAGLLYSLTPVSEAATTSSADASGSLNGAWSVAPNTAVYSQSAAFLPGYYVGPIFTLPGGFDGQVVYFEVIAFQTGALGADSAAQYANSTVRGHSAAFTGVLYNIPITMDKMGKFQVFPVPEPGTLGILAFGGLFFGWRWLKSSRFSGNRHTFMN